MKALVTVFERRAQWIRAAQVAGLLTLGLLVPGMGLPQPITGPLVNALLILSVDMVGPGAAALVGLVTPLSALVHGVLPLPLMVMIPFISVANAVLTTVYSTLRRRNRWLAIVIAAASKFAWLYAVVTWLAARPLAVMVGGSPVVAAMPALVISMMQWPQLFTALAGGVIAMGLSWVMRTSLPGATSAD